MDDASTRQSPTLIVESAGDWKSLLGDSIKPLAAALASALPTRRWFGSKTRTIRETEILDVLPVSQHVYTFIVNVRFTMGPDEIYQVPLAFVPAASSQPDEALTWIHVHSTSGENLGSILDGLSSPDFCEHLLGLFAASTEVVGQTGRMQICSTPAFATTRGDVLQPLAAKLVHAEQSNTSVIFGDRLIMKVFRRVETGLNPDFEISEFLTQRNFASTPPLAGTITYQQDGAPWGLAMLQAFVPNQGDAWKFTIDWLASAMPSFRGSTTTDRAPPLPNFSLVPATIEQIPPEAELAFGGYLKRMSILGQRTAEMHLALAADAENKDFCPEPFTEVDRKSFYAQATEYVKDTFGLLHERMDGMPESTREHAKQLEELRPAALDLYAHLANDSIPVDKIRIHGDYHLGQVLATADDFAIIDFEGEPVRSIEQRRRKQLALRDVAGMIRSLHYASCTAATTACGQGIHADSALNWTQAWYAWSSVAFLTSYRNTAGAAGFLPQSLDEFERQLDGCLLEKAVYELRYELNNRPDWVYLPLTALVNLLSA